MWKETSALLYHRADGVYLCAFPDFRQTLIALIKAFHHRSLSIMDTYIASLTLLTLILVIAAYWKSTQDNGEASLFSSPEDHQLEMLDEEIHDIDRETTADRYHGFRQQFLIVYGLAIAADWLQVR